MTRPTVAVALLAQGAMACAADTPLGSAVGRGDISAVRAQLAAGHDANAGLTEGWTPLTVAASAGNVPLMILLVQAGADVDRPKDSWLNQDGRSPLHWAASSGNANVVRTLIEFDGMTPRAVALRNGHTAVVALLDAAASK